jgi:hypothetical protein
VNISQKWPVRDGIHVMVLGCKTPCEVFQEHAREAFNRTLDLIDQQDVSVFESVTVTEGGADWKDEGLLGPSSTWTYLVTDMPFSTGPLAAMAGRPSLGLLVAWMYWPLWIGWGFCRKWKMRKRTRR